jgi:hypothetical protein
MYVTDHDDTVAEPFPELPGGIWRSTSNSWIGGSTALYDTDSRAIEEGLFWKYDYNHDGHVEHWRWLWPKSRSNWPTYVKVAENPDDLRDLRRVQQALPLLN